MRKLSNKMILKISLIAIFGLLLYGAYWFQSKAFFLETAEYTVAVKDGAFEIRDYSELAIASTNMMSSEDGSGFGKLFGFISGNNENNQAIAMTTPVFIDQEGSKSRMSFVVPKSVEQEGIPDPNNHAVFINKRPADRFAVYRYSGVDNRKLKKQALQKLRKWITEKDIDPVGEAVFAYYDAPFIPGPFRRNEVMIRINQERNES